MIFSPLNPPIANILPSSRVIDAKFRLPISMEGPTLHESVRGSYISRLSNALLELLYPPNKAQFDLSRLVLEP
uniref:Uncharacterized protein n=1 Tax=Cryptosporidium parvum TaxID=5807 RepID=F0X5V0_CRYPV